MKKTILILIAISFAGYIFSTQLNMQVEQKPLKYFLDLWKISIEGTENFVVKNYQEDKLEDIKISEIKTIGRNQTIFIKRFSNVDLNFQKNYFDDKTNELNFLFETTPAPYPGVITRTIVCPDEFKPIINERENNIIKSIAYVMYSNERFTYGICSSDLIKYRAIFSLVYCKTKNEIYQIEYFIPVEEFVENDVERITSFKCI